MIYFPWIVSSVVVYLWYRTARVVWGAISKNGGTPFQTAIPDLVAYTCLCLQADGGERNCEETQKTKSRSWWFSATCGERREDRTLSGVWRCYLQKWRALCLKKRSLILLLELVYVRRRIAVSGRATKCERYEEQVVANSHSWWARKRQNGKWCFEEPSPEMAGP